MTTQTLYETAYAEALSGHDISQCVLAIDPQGDSWSIIQIVTDLRRLLQRNDITPKQIAGIAKLLLGLGRLPLITPGLDVLLSLQDRFDDETTSFEIGLSVERFYVSSGGTISGPLGVDAYSGVTVEIEPGFHSDHDLSEVNWLNELAGLADHLSVSIQDDSDDALLDWDHGDGSFAWSALAGDL